MALTFSDENGFVDQQLLFNVKVLATNVQIKEELKKVQEILSSGLKATEINKKGNIENYGMELIKENWIFLLL